MSRPATLHPVKPGPFQPDSQNCASKGPLYPEYGCRRSATILGETGTRRNGDTILNYSPRPLARLTARNRAEAGPRTSAF